MSRLTSALAFPLALVPALALAALLGVAGPAAGQEPPAVPPLDELTEPAGEGESQNLPPQDPASQDAAQNAVEAAEGEEPPPSDASEAALEEEVPRPPNKPVTEMTEEELKIFRRWRQHQLEKREAEQAAKEAEKAAPEGAVTFELSFPPEKGGGSASGWAGSMRFQRDDLAVLADGVVIRYQDIEVAADLIEVDLTEKKVDAFGNVVLDQGPRRLAGATLSFDMETKTGTITNASAYVDPDFYFSGTEITKTGENTYHVEDGVFTSCEGDVPAWSFTLGRADIEVDGYARVRHAAMKVKRAPVLYLPYVLWPVKRDRTSGFLVPNIGYSDRRGAYLGLAYYQVLGQSYDTTFFLDLYGEEYLGVGNEFRYQPTEGTEGKLELYTIRDPERDDWLWKANLDHRTTDLPFGMRGVLTVREFSDFEFFREFERSIDKNTVRSIESKGFASGSWGPHSLNILAHSRETFIANGQNVVLERLPEVEYKLRPTQIAGLPLRFGLESSVSYLGVDRSELLESDYGRADLVPQLSLPLRLAPWLSFSVAAGYRYTWYGDSIGPNEAGATTFTGDSLTRDFPFASAEIVGPSFSRIFDRKGGRYEKIKHVIEPRFTYGYQDEFEDAEFVPLFDEIDRFGSFNLGKVALINRVLAKERPKEEGKAASAREILSWELSRDYSFDDDRPLQRGTLDGEARSTQVGPLESLLRFNPSERTNITARLEYDTLFSQLESSSLSGSIALGRSTAAVSWRTDWNVEDGEKRSDQMRIGGAFDLLPRAWGPRRLKITADVVYDIEDSLIQQQRYILDYGSKCYSYRLEWRETELGNEVDQDLRFSLTLKNVGTFLDLTN